MDEGRSESPIDSYAAGSLGNPSVHSLLVTLGNHAFHDFQTYNGPCPVGHPPINEMTAVAYAREQVPQMFGGFCR